MNDTLTSIKTRYACRAYTDQPVPAGTLKAIAEAGLAAPSAMNRQPWRIIAVSNPEAIAALETAAIEALKAADQAGYERIMSRGGKMLYGAPALILIAEQTGVGGFPASMDVGIVASHIALAARSLGVDSVIAALPGFAFRGPAGPQLRALFQIPDGFDFSVSVLLGYAAAPGAPHQPDESKLIVVE
jgi:nitroreductase